MKVTHPIRGRAEKLEYCGGSGYDFICNNCQHCIIQAADECGVQAPKPQDTHCPVRDEQGRYN